MIIDAVTRQLLVCVSQCGRSGRAQINRRFSLGDDFGKRAAYLQAGRVFAGRRVIAFDRLVDPFESADLISHLASKFFEHFLQMLEIAADKELRLFGRDVERLIHRVDGVGDLLHPRLEA